MLVRVIGAVLSALDLPDDPLGLGTARTGRAGEDGRGGGMGSSFGDAPRATSDGPIWGARVVGHYARLSWGRAPVTGVGAASVRPARGRPDGTPSAGRVA
ncbi:MAG: hypothetical protein QOF33_4696 [Thermomicrobiales bacterium]|jgi:hypothetical protein|nr:hypothetical protein [Thermomicrobiales bacterium]